MNESHAVFWSGIVWYVRALDSKSVATESTVCTFLHHDSIGRVVDTVPGDLCLPVCIAGKLGQMRTDSDSLVRSNRKGNGVRCF